MITNDFMRRLQAKNNEIIKNVELDGGKSGDIPKPSDYFSKEQKTNMFKENFIKQSKSIENSIKNPER